LPLAAGAAGKARNRNESEDLPFAFYRGFVACGITGENQNSDFPPAVRPVPVAKREISEVCECPF